MPSSVQPIDSRPTNEVGRETRRVLIRTAERLFAEQGLDAVSLRQISAEAGMRMSGAVAYHFGDKAGLIRAIIDDRSARMDERCRPLLEELERQGRLDDLRAVTEATIRPAVTELGETGYYFRFLAQLDRHPQALSELQASVAFRPAAGRIIELQDHAAARHLPPKLVGHRRQLVTHVVLAALADLETAAQRGVDESLVSDLIDCIVGMYMTPASEQTIKALPASSRRSAEARRRAQKTRKR
jgi:AcrR family transcriptional regulator